MNMPDVVAFLRKNLLGRDGYQACYSYTLPEARVQVDATHLWKRDFPIEGVLVVYMPQRQSVAKVFDMGYRWGRHCLAQFVQDDKERQERDRASWAIVRELKKGLALKEITLEQAEELSRKAEPKSRPHVERGKAIFNLLLALAGAHPGLLKNYRNDLLVHDRYTAELLQPGDEFVWVLRESGTELCNLCVEPVTALYSLEQHPEAIAWHGRVRQNDAVVMEMSREKARAFLQEWRFKKVS